MKTQFSLLAVACISSISQAQASEVFELIPGSEISIDVANQGNIQLKLNVPHTGKSHLAVPEAVVVETNGGFECTIESNKFVSTRTIEDGTKVSSYIIEVNWFPGTDSSSCLVDVKGAGLKTAAAFIYMSY